jgi:SAM-dependent methyltransferase
MRTLTRSTKTPAPVWASSAEMQVPDPVSPSTTQQSAPRATAAALPIDSAVAAANSYTLMQREYYDTTAHIMNEVNHRHHNANQDYWDILVADTEKGFRDRTGLDFGCGCGRNIQNLWYRFARMDGVDISPENLKHAHQNILAEGCPPHRFGLTAVSGVDLAPLSSDKYDFIMSTIVLQHICVHEIRKQYFHEFFRVMAPGGLLSLQMGFGDGWGKAEYTDNHYDALGTNSHHDTKVTDPDQLRVDLEAAGFTDFRYVLRPSFSDGHPFWIFFKARKPALA